ncbi:MAG: hypothetical protein NT049_11525 [Planctomycetota bacterium]|nr:hypothetical protein [Planctomycetota bacterium]
MSRSTEAGPDKSCDADTQASMPMNDTGVLSAAWRHRGLVLLITAAWCLAAGIYLKFTPWAYTSAAKLSVEAAGPRILAGDERQPARSPGYLAQQCEVIKSAPLLGDAVARLDPGDLASLGNSGDPVEFLKGSLDASASRKDEVITVGLDSPDPRLGARVVGTVVETYLDHRTRQQQETSKEVLRILRKELAARETELAAKQKALVALDYGSGPARDAGKTDLAAQQLRWLYEVLSESEFATLAAEATCDAAQTLAHDPARLRLFAESQGVVDRQSLSDSVQVQLVAEHGRLESQLASLRQELSDEHPSVQSLKARLEAVTAQLAQVAQRTDGALEQYLDVFRQRLQIARRREAGIRESFQQQQQASLRQQQQQQVSRQSNTDTAKSALLQAEVRQAERLCDVLKGRILETSAAQEAGAMDVRIIEPVFTASLPTSPKIGMHLAAAGGIGAMLGALLALRRERSPRRPQGRFAGDGAAGSAGRAARPAAYSPGAEAGQPAEEAEEVAARHNN